MSPTHGGCIWHDKVFSSAFLCTRLRGQVAFVRLSQLHRVSLLCLFTQRYYIQPLRRVAWIDLSDLYRFPQNMYYFKKKNLNYSFSGQTARYIHFSSVRKWPHMTCFCFVNIDLTLAVKYMDSAVDGLDLNLN